MTGPSIIVLDNAPQTTQIDSAELAAVLTSRHWSDRVLGSSRTVVLPNNALWILTANNPQFSMELVRRSIRIRMDTQTDRPWERQQFRHLDLITWTRANRAKLIEAVIVLVENWTGEQKPVIAERLGGFEEWSDVIGGILLTANVEGFLNDREDFYQFADAEGEAWRDFVEAWYDTFGESLTTVDQLEILCDERDLLPNVVGSGNQKSRSTCLGIALSRQFGRVFGSHRIELAKDKGKKKGRLYRLGRPAADDEGDVGGDVGAPPDKRPPSQPIKTKDSCDDRGTLEDLFGDQFSDEERKPRVDPN